MRVRLRAYWRLIKSLQTGLLLVTGMAGYMSACCPVLSWPTMLGMTLTLFMAISGSTILNMVYDRDIDSRMKRTFCRPLPAGAVSPQEALWTGLMLSVAGVAGAVALAPLYGAVVFAGLFFDVVVYTIWLKRRTAWSIVWGGIAGGMPILAGRVLGTGQIEIVGILLSLAILFWIPTHIMTYGIKHAADYQRANIPTFATRYGERVTRSIISLSTGVAIVLMAIAVIKIELAMRSVYANVGMGGVLVGMAILVQVYPSEKLNLGLFKCASLYMLVSMGLIIFNV